MNMLPTILVFLGAVLAPHGPEERAPAHWKLFVSKTQHFSVLYPPSWNRLLGLDYLPDTDRLEIINFPNSERARGVVIKKGGAFISVVGVAPDSPPFGWHTVDDWIRFSLRAVTALDQTEIPVAAPTPGQCTTLKRVVRQIEMSPGAWQVDTSYYCTVGGWLYATFQTNWKGDPHQSDLQDTALKIALSLRSQ